MNKTKKFVFVLMPFDEKFNDIYSYGIKQTCTEINAYCERVDEQIFSERILDRIYNQISKSDIIVADMTDRNANVFYEVGYAHGLGKNVILLTQKSEDIPFDLKHFPHIIYDGKIKNLSDNLKLRLEWFLKEENNPEDYDLDFGLEFLIDGEKIEQDKILKYQFGSVFDSESLKLDIYNSSTKIYKTKFKIGLELNSEFEKMFYEEKPLKPNPDKIIITSKEISSLYPSAYKSIEFPFKKPLMEDKSRIIDLKLKVFTNFELKEISFKIEFLQPDMSSWGKY